MIVSVSLGSYRPDLLLASIVSFGAAVAFPSIYSIKGVSGCHGDELPRDVKAVPSLNLNLFISLTEILKNGILFRTSQWTKKINVRLGFLFLRLKKKLFDSAVVHASKDKILLDGDQNGDYDDYGGDDEVFALKGIDNDSEEDEGFYEDDEILDDEAEIETEAPATKKKSKHSRKVKGKTAESPEPEEEEEEEEEGWGRGRAAYYSSNADQLESDDEEGNELEEQETKRLQAAARKEMTDDDFGLNDNPEVMQKDSDMEYGHCSLYPFVIITESLQVASQKAHLLSFLHYLQIKRACSVI